MEQREIPIHQSLHRHTLVFGAEREPAMFSFLIAGLVGIGGMNMISAACALAFWVTIIFALRVMAKSDPQMFQIWLRHIKQQPFYPAKGHCWRKIGGYIARS